MIHTPINYLIRINLTRKSEVASSVLGYGLFLEKKIIFNDKTPLTHTHSHTREVSQHNKDVPGQGATTARKLFPVTKATHSSDSPVIKSEPGDNLHQTSITTDNTSVSQPRPWRHTYDTVVTVAVSCRFRNLLDSTDLTDITLPGIIFDAQVCKPSTVQ